MVKGAVHFGKIFNLMIYKTTSVALLCCKSHTHAANIKFQPNACSSCLKQYFPFLLPNPNPLLNPLPVLVILLNPYLPVIVALKILQEILLFTRSLMINTHPLVGCLENSDRKLKKLRVIPRIASRRLVYCVTCICTCTFFQIWPDCFDHIWA